jgi:heme-degrading monooxygenase HmoA
VSSLGYAQRNEHCVSPYVYIWEFLVRPGREAEFELHYGPAGSWVQLFRTASGYLDTVLLRDLANPCRYLTIDRWESEAAYRAFREARATDFVALDSRCEALIVSEREIGQWDGVSC